MEARNFDRRLGLQAKMLVFRLHPACMGSVPDRIVFAGCSEKCPDIWKRLPCKKGLVLGRKRAELLSFFSISLNIELCQFTVHAYHSIRSVLGRFAPSGNSLPHRPPRRHRFGTAVSILGSEGLETTHPRPAMTGPTKSEDRRGSRWGKK